MEATVFEESFRDLLITNLVNLGVPTSPTPGKDAIVINYKAQMVYHQRNRWRTLKPGLLTALTAGVLVFRNAPSELIALAIAGAIDFANATYVSVSNFDVIITTSVIAKEHYLFRNSNIYYINDQDSWHYMMPSSPAEIKLTSRAAHVPERVEVITESRAPYPQANTESPVQQNSTGI